jgi:hypothetical protein
MIAGVMMRSSITTAITLIMPCLLLLGEAKEGGASGAYCSVRRAVRAALTFFLRELLFATHLLCVPQRSTFPTSLAKRKYCQAFTEQLIPCALFLIADRTR